MLLLGELSLWQTFYEAYKEDQLRWTGWVCEGTEGLRTKLTSTNSVPISLPSVNFGKKYKKYFTQEDNFLIKHCRISFYFLHFLSHGEVIKCAATWIMADNDNIPSDYKHSPSDEKQNFISTISFAIFKTNEKLSS